MPAPSPCRVYFVMARDAPVAAVFRRGPANWWQVLRWDFAAGVLEAGAWLNGTLYPRRCTLSPDGDLLSYFALKGGGGKSPWETFHAVSRLPWVTALVAWKTFGTWTTSMAIRKDGSGSRPAGAFHGACPDHVGFGTAWLPRHFNLTGREDDVWQPIDAPARYLAAVPTRDIAFPDKPVVLSVAPRDGLTLVMVYRGGTYRGPAAFPCMEGAVVDYLLESPNGELTSLDAMVANWDARGRLLVADRQGHLHIDLVRDGKLERQWEADLNTFTKASRGPSPPWARTWDERRPK